MSIKEKIIVLLLCSGILAVFVGIGFGIYFYSENHRVSEGYITDKIYIPANHSINRNGNSYYPARYYFTIAGENGGEYSEWTIDVTESEYNSYKLGEYYP